MGQSRSSQEPDLLLLDHSSGHHGSLVVRLERSRLGCNHPIVLEWAKGFNGWLIPLRAGLQFCEVIHLGLVLPYRAKQVDFPEASLGNLGDSHRGLPYLSYRFVAAVHVSVVMFSL